MEEEEEEDGGFDNYVTPSADQVICEIEEIYKVLNIKMTSLW